ncbi:MAG: hypothetical protein WCO78_00580 [Candidatus Roizmanbacteria bacterium]
MKKTPFIIMSLLVFLVPTAWAVSSAPTPSTTPLISPAASTSASLESSAEASIKNLRDRIASKVAQLRKRDEQAVSGQIISMTDSEFVIESIFGKKETIQLDETLTKYYHFTGSAREETTKANIKVDQYIVVLGPRSSDKIIANEVFKDELYQIKSGRVSEVNPSNSTIKIDTFDKESITVSVEGTTALQTINVSTGAVAGGSFSNIKEGDTVHVVFRVLLITQKIDKVTASRILHIPVAYFSK